MKKSLKRLQDEARRAQNAAWAAEKVQRDKDNAKLIGCCFKYHNSGGGCDDKWWLYAKVVRVADGSLRVFKFQKMPNGNIKIEPDQYTSPGHISGGGYKPIENAEFDREWRAVCGAIVALAP